LEDFEFKTHNVFSGTGQLVMYGTDTSSDVAVSATPSSDVNVTTQHETNVTLYIVFGVVSLVFVVVIIVVVKIMRRKNANPNGYTLTSTGKKQIFLYLYFFVNLDSELLCIFK
jgi:heme/copper-type cytochrome/quinol oxidase subunit 2